MTKYFCDRCGEERSTHKFYINLNTLEIEKVDYEICAICVQFMINHIHILIRNK